MKIKISKDRSVFPYRTNVSNQYENKTDSIEFDLDVPNGNKYLFVEIDGKTVPYPLINPFPITSDLSWTAGGHRACVVVSNVEIKDTINKEDTLFISDEFMLVVAKNFINPNDVSQDALPEPLKIVYDDLMSLKKELENKLSNGDFNGDSAYEVAVKNGYKGTEEEWIASLKGEKGDKGEPYNHSEEFQQLALQVERKATDAENAAQSALESKTSALQGATSALEASESAKQSAISASKSAQSAKDGATSALQSANSAKESAMSASQSAQSAEQAKGYAEQAQQTATEKAGEAITQAQTAAEQATLATSKANEAKQSAESAKQSSDELRIGLKATENKLVGKSSVSKTAIVEDSYDDKMSIRLFGNAIINEIKATGENLFPSDAQYNQPIPLYLKDNIPIVIKLKDGKQSLGGNLKALNEDGTESWFGVDKGVNVKRYTNRKKTKSIINLLSVGSDPNDVCLTIGDTEKYIHYQEKKAVLSTPITLRAVENENGNVTIDGKRCLSDILLKKDGKYQIKRNLSEGNQPLEKVTYEQLNPEDEKKIEELVSFNHYTTLTADGAHCEFEYTQNANVVKNSLISRILKLESGGVEQLQIKETVYGNSVTLKDSTDLRIADLKLFGRSWQTAEPTPESPQKITHQFVNAVSVNDRNYNFVNTKLMGIADEENYNCIVNGKKFMSDYICKKDGSWGVMHLIAKVQLNKTATFSQTPDNKFRCLSIDAIDNVTPYLRGGNIPSMSNYFIYTPWANGVTDKWAFAINENTIYISTPKALTDGSKEQVERLVTEKYKQIVEGLAIYSQLAEPYFEAFSESQTEFDEIMTVYPTCTVRSNASMELTYVADPKNYIDKKLNEINAKLLRINSEIGGN